jgi:hypothetical protein
MQEIIISDPREYPTMLINWWGNNFVSIWARYLPNVLATAIAGTNGLSVYFLCNSYLILSAVKISKHALPINFIKLVILSLVHCTAYI